MGILLHQDRRVAALKNVADAIMTTVEALRIHAVELPHPPREIGIRRFDEKVVVIAHRAVGMQRPVVALPDLSEDVEKQMPVVVGQVDILRSRHHEP